MLTVQEIKQALPKHLRTAATQALTDKVNNITNDPEVAKDIRENFISYTGVLMEGRFKTEDYLNAVAYVSFKLMGCTNQEAYRRTFNDRYTHMVGRGDDEKTISAYVASYAKNKLVNLIMEQTLVPTWVLNQESYQKAINVQVELMMSSPSDKVRTDAANSLLTHLKRPETKQVEINVGLKENDGMRELNDMLSSLAEKQQELIGQGVSTREIAHQPLGSPLPNSQSHHTKSNQPEIIDITPVEEEPAPEPVKQKSAPVDLGSTPLTSYKPEIQK